MNFIVAVICIELMEIGRSEELLQRLMSGATMACEAGETRWE